MAEEKKIATGYIGNALRSAADNHTTTFADEIFDTERQKYQNEVNTDLETTDNEIKADLKAETARATKEEELLQDEIDNTNTALSTLDDKVNLNQGQLAELETKTEEITKEVIETGDDYISVEDNNGNEVFHLDENGLDAKNVKSNGHTVLTDVDCKYLATKEEVEEKADKEYFSDIITKKEEHVENEDTIVLATNKNDELVEITGGNIEEQQDEIIYTDDSGDDEYAKIDERGVHGKNLYYKEDGLEKNIKDEFSRINSKSSDYRDTDAIYERDYIKTNYKKDGVPYYLDNPSEQTSYGEDNYLEQKIKNVPTSGKKFIFVTDTHWYSNQKRSNYLINYVKKRLGIKKVIFGGDAINSEKTNPNTEHGAYAKYLALHELTDYGNEFFACFGNDAIWCEGNHDANYVGFLNAMKDGVSFSDYSKYIIDDTEIFKRTIANVYGAKFDDIGLAAIDNLPYTTDVKNNIKAFAKMTYYVDDVSAKIRYIVYDTGVNGIAQLVYMASSYGNSTHYFYNSLIRFIKTCPDNYDIVVLGHMLKNNISDNIHPILSAFKAGAASISLESWNWKSCNDIQIYFTETDLELDQSSPNIGDEAYIKTSQSTTYLLYKCLTQGIWEKTNQTLRGVYSSYETLVNNIPSPNINNFAYVLTGKPYTYTKYKCAETGTWSVTSDVVERSSDIITYGHNSPILSALLPEYTSPIFNISIGKKVSGRIFTLSGHYHADNVFICESTSNIGEGGQVSTRAYSLNSQYIEPSQRKNDAILEIITDTDSFNIGSGENGVSNPKERDTITEQCFDVVTITDDNHVVCTRFGAGSDRNYII